MAWYKTFQTIQSPVLEFRNENRGAHNDQSDMTLFAYLPSGKYVGRLEYSVYQDEPHIQYIEVQKPLRRKGYGKAMMLELQRQFPDVEIDTGMSTEDGTAMLEKMKTKFLPNDVYIKLNDEKTKLSKRLEELQVQFDARDSMSPAEVEATRPQFNKMCEEWSRLDQRVWEIDEALARMKPGKTLFV
jgi:GNAT superfamily N-acetyltransferase